MHTLWIQLLRVLAMIEQTTMEMCNNCAARFWSFDPFTPIHCLKCEYLGLPVSYTMRIDDGSDVA